MTMGTIGVHEFITVDGVAETGPAAKFALAGSEAYSNGVLYLTYTLAAPGGE